MHCSAEVVVSVVQRLEPSICHRDLVSVTLIDPLTTWERFLFEAWVTTSCVLGLISIFAHVRQIIVNILEDDSYFGKHWLCSYM